MFRLQSMRHILKDASHNSLRLPSRTLISIARNACMNNKTKQRALPKLVNPEDVFANNQMNLNDIHVYGFDYDYTLAHYKPGKVEHFIYKEALHTLVDQLRYPKGLLDLEYDENFVIRGLHYDIENELLMKLDSYSIVNKVGVYHGRQLLTQKKIDRFYRSRNIPVWKLEQSPNLSPTGSTGTFYAKTSRFHHVSDRFSVPEQCLVCDVIHWMNKHRVTYDGTLVFEDIKQAVGRVHISGRLYNEIQNNIEEYLERGALKEVINHLREANKQLFILTNSPFSFVNAGMKHLLDERNWPQHFELVVLRANKPSFFTHRDRKFRSSGEKWSLGGDPKPEFESVRRLQKGFMYHGGCLRELQRLTNWEPKEILFFGDHLYADLADAILLAGWRTACIVPELESEINTINSEEFQANVQRLIELEDKLETEQKYNKLACKEQLEEWQEERSKTKKVLRDLFNPNFGSIFRCEMQTSYFHRRLARFGEIYTSNVSNLARFPLDITIYPKRTSLPHEHSDVL